VRIRVRLEVPRREIQGSFEERMDLEGDLILKEMEMEKIHSRGGV